MASDVEGESVLPPSKKEHQAKLNSASRRKTLAELLGFAREHGMKFVDVVELANVLSLDGELDDLVAQLPERHRRKVDVAAVRRELELKVDEDIDQVVELPEIPAERQ